MKATILEVADRANVSVATVSRVMNNNYPVKAETREKVLKAIKELNYIPNMQARELTQKKSATIGIVSPSISNMFFTEVIKGIESYLRDKSLSLLLTCTNDDADEEQKCITNLVSRNVSGIIVISPNTLNVKSGFYDDISDNMPLVFINSYHVDSNISCVSNDESMGANIALNYLLKNNHKEILFVRGKDSYSYDIKEEVYTKNMKELGLFNTKNIINIGNGNSSDTVDNTTEVFLKLLKTTKATAAFACNDLMAVGILNACKRLNLVVPQDFSIIGYDDISLSKFVEPKLTTVDQNMFLLGTNAATLLIEKIDCDNKYSKRIILNNYIVERDTVSSI
ncbi:LacI family DNA-binding transcriptional regulator [Clostridium felsineum]|uniref:Catabolite control protein A n=1 Tax=Clostridium felsineum TaxID=36839 RepID=A0A1S8L7P4_9CLOT|nr:LacI family DNA-binding transcriptional regulator [Clostridium felsineum]MCR3758292.1 LacI family transcriptional regulator [Clostridium felsineum]URZ03631.1 Catabolite control protein A [Clostridium felsineum]URZ08054.1 Catabolite control protein A [Clostridium felsineum]URZ13085.1 Catabolite control protein A [Clostridium felsineum]URZ14937.1 Catabolite control protein A [Clostridium felsineum DSM 794]